MAAEKYKNPELDRELFPVFVQNGSVSAVFRHCVENGKTLTKPTLAKMASYFGWKKRREEAVEQQSAAAPKTGDALQDLLNETRIYKDRLKNEVGLGVGDLPLSKNEGMHRLYGAALAQEMAIVKFMAERGKKEKDNQKGRIEKMSKEELVKFIREDVYGLK